MVAIVAGGVNFNLVEIYSPNGGCSRSLGAGPLSNYNPIMGVINEKLTYCSGYYDNRFSLQLVLVSQTWPCTVTSINCKPNEQSKRLNS